MLVLKHNIPGIPENTEFKKVDGSDNLYSSDQVPGLLVSINNLKEINIDTNSNTDTIDTENVVSETTSNILNLEKAIEEKLPDELKEFFRGILNQQFLVGQKYRMYSVEEQRWAGFTYANTLTHIARVKCGFAIKSPSTDSEKDRLLKCLELIYGITLNTITF